MSIQDGNPSSRLASDKLHSKNLGQRVKAWLEEVHDSVTMLLSLATISDRTGTRLG